MLAAPSFTRSTGLLLGLLSGLMFAAACSRPQTASVSTSTTNAGIVGGHEVTQSNALSSRVVFITGIDKDTGNAEFCTGSLLPGHLVLAAAHCLDNIGDQLTIDFGRSFPIDQDLIDGDYARKVIARRKNPNYDAAGAEARRGLDLSLLKFTGSIPKGFTTFNMPDETSTALVPKASETLYMIGFGQTDPATKNEGTLRMLAIPSTRILSESLDAYWSLDGSNSGSCFGDSGGPLVMVSGGQPQIIGVASRIFSTDSGPSCSGKDIYTRLGPQLKWLQQAAHELAGVTN